MVMLVEKVARTKAVEDMRAPAIHTTKSPLINYRRYQMNSIYFTESNLEFSCLLIMKLYMTTYAMISDLV